MLQADGRANPRGLGTERGAEHVGSGPLRDAEGLILARAFLTWLLFFFFLGGTHNFWLLQAGWCSQGPSCHLQLAAGLAAPKASLPVQVVSE